MKLSHVDDSITLHTGTILKITILQLFYNKDIIITTGITIFFLNAAGL
jgi:hypothetical protein